MNIEWDAKRYNKNFSFVSRYGGDLIELIDASKAVSVLDLGCGSGVLSKKLAEKGFKVTGLDSSSSLLELAAKTYPEIKFIKADAVDFKLESKVDVVFSNAVLHWIDESRQKRLLSCVYDALSSKGQFVLEMGGFGNNRIIHEGLKHSFSRYGLVYKMPFYFPTIGQYATLLEQAGFTVRSAWLFDRPTALTGPDGLKDWILMFVKIPFEGIDRDLKLRIIAETVESLKDKLLKDWIWYADYVRLRIKAEKSE